MRRVKKVEKDWRNEWKEMPEFIQENREAIKRVSISFETQQDIDNFNALTGLNIGLKTKGVFFPPVERKGKRAYVYEP